MHTEHFSMHAAHFSLNTAHLHPPFHFPGCPRFALFSGLSEYTVLQYTAMHDIIICTSALCVHSCNRSGNNGFRLSSHQVDWCPLTTFPTM